MSDRRGLIDTRQANSVFREKHQVDGIAQAKVETNKGRQLVDKVGRSKPDLDASQGFADLLCKLFPTSVLVFGLLGYLEKVVGLAEHPGSHVHHNNHAKPVDGHQRKVGHSWKWDDGVEADAGIQTYDNHGAAGGHNCGNEAGLEHLIEKFVEQLDLAVQMVSCLGEWTFLENPSRELKVVVHAPDAQKEEVEHVEARGSHATHPHETVEDKKEDPQ